MESRCDDEFVLGRHAVGKAIRITSEPDDIWNGEDVVIEGIKAPTVCFPFAFDVRKYKFFAEIVE
jgi:hypothetical protein